MLIVLLGLILFLLWVQLTTPIMLCLVVFGLIVVRLSVGHLLFQPVQVSNLLITGSSPSSPISAAGTYSATYKTQYYQTVTSSPATGSGYITVDGVAQATPYQAWWDSGSSHSIAATSSVTIVSGQSQYIYSSWSDSGAQSHSVSPTAVTTYTASFQLQYYFSVSSTRDSPTGQGWYNSGSSVSSTVTRPVSGGTGIQYETTGWTGTGSLSSGGSAGSSSTGSFTINAYSTCTWNWKTQYQVTFSSDWSR